MSNSATYDAVVIGSGPNGLAAGITLARAGLSVIIFESKETVGGGMRTAELTLPGFHHDVCSAIHPLGISSPFFLSLSLGKFGLEWIQPMPLAHPFDDGTAALLERSIQATKASLGVDAAVYQRLIEPLVADWDNLANELLAPLHFLAHPLSVARFSLLACRSAAGLIDAFFKGKQASSLFAGLAAHSFLPLDKAFTSAFGLVLGVLGHRVGWPLPRGGSQQIADALAACFVSYGGTIVTAATIENIDALPASRLILCDITPKQLLQLAGHRLPEGYKKKMEKYRYGPGVFKVDWALNHPIPWKTESCKRAGTVHLGGSAEEIIFSEKAVWQGKCSERPYVIIAQQSLFDPTRAPEGKHTAWGYCHVPHASTVDMTTRIEAQIERFAPGFQECILARSTFSPLQFQQYNPNYIGGDITGGVQDIWQLFTRPTARLVPYSTPLKGLYLCSASTPPGGGVHGMCGYHAALAALKTL